MRKSLSSFAIVLAALVLLLCSPARVEAQHIEKGQVSKQASGVQSVHERVAGFGYFGVYSEEFKMMLVWDGLSDEKLEVSSTDSPDSFLCFFTREESNITVYVLAPEKNPESDWVIFSFDDQGLGGTNVTVSTDESLRGERWTVPNGDGPEMLMAIGRSSRCVCKGPGGAPTTSCSTVGCDDHQECSNLQSVHYCQWTTLPKAIGVPFEWDF